MPFTPLHARLAAVLLALAGPSAAFWKIPCTSPLLHERADPVVNPGQVSSHAHTIMGGNGFGFNMDYAQARASSCSTCRAPADRSNYWVPSLYFREQNGSFTSVQQVGGALIYYLQRMDPGKDESSLHAFPEGFRMVAGDPLAREDLHTVQSQAVNFTCLGVNREETCGLPNYNCPGGLRTQIFFPSCWNGVDVDSPDHKSHVVYPSTANGGTCPPGFDTRLISIFYEILWAVDAFKDKWYGNGQPFVFSHGDPTGFGYHGDFVNGWDVATLQTAINTCTDGNHGGGNNGDINLCQPLLPLISDEAAQGCVQPPSVPEQIFGTLPALPGCNPVQPGPGRATPQSGCGAPTTIGKPEAFYSDLTASKGWEYLGCGSDIAFTARTLPDAATAGPDMTVEKCVDFCVGKGYSYAGLEFADECYCGNSLAANRAPQPGLPGNCMMKCAGNSAEYCGGPQRISLYKKCDGGGCKNVDSTVLAATSSKSRKLHRRRRPALLDAAAA
ncbi:MAG: hypothetical protein M1826_006636 [Phylliscum demangeonii]|nr:MAG: hypothetical protein M1826_006636 [Phylliscum demangeonii]